MAPPTNCDELLVSVAGFGVWQLWIYFCIGVAQFFETMINLAIIFMQITPKFQCDSEIGDFQCDAAVELQLNNTNFTYLQTTKCHKWLYDRSVMAETIVTQWDLVCDRKVRVADTQMAYVFGDFVGAIITGFTADRYGRKKVLVIAGVLTATMGILQPRAPTFLLFLFSRFLLSVLNSACYQSGYVLCMEVTSSRYRVWVGGLFYVPYALGYINLALTAYMWPNWIIINTVASCPLLITLIYWWVVPESPRWLWSKNRRAEAEKVLAFAAKVNRKQTSFQEELPTDVDLLNSEAHEKHTGETPDSARSVTFFAIFKHRTLVCGCFLICFLWIANAMVYYGISLNVSFFPGNVFLNNALAGAVEIPAYIATVPLLYWSRKKSISLTMMMAAASLFAAPFIDRIWLKLTLAMMGKFSVTASFSMLYLVTAELYATCIRSSGVTSGNTVARLGSVMAPYVNLLSQPFQGSSVKWLPLVIFGTMAFLGGLVVLLLPETKGQPMPETIHDALRLFGSSDATQPPNNDDEEAKAEVLDKVALRKQTSPEETV